MKKLEKILDGLYKQKAIIAKSRDKLRKLYSEFEEIANNAEDADGYLQDSIDDLETALDFLSENL